MHIKLKLKLYDKIGKWIDEIAEDPDTPTMFFGEKTQELMTEAAASVFDGIVDAYQYMESGGHLSDK